MAAPSRDNVKNRPLPPPDALPSRFSEHPPAAHRRQISAAGRILHCRARGAQPAALHGPPHRWLDGATFQRPPRSLRREPRPRYRSKKLVVTNVTPSNAATKSMRCPTLWGRPHPSAGRIENASKTCVNAMTAKQPIPQACSAEAKLLRVRKRTTETPRKTQAAASARRPFRTAAPIRNGAL